MSTTFWFLMLRPPASATIDKWGLGDLVTTYEDPNVVDIDQRSSTFSLPNEILDACQLHWD